MKKILFILFLGVMAMCSFFVKVTTYCTSVLAPVKAFVRDCALILATFAGFSLMSLTASASELAEGVTFFSILVETWSLLPLYAQIIGVLWLLVPVFSMIVSATDTPTDDSLWGKWIYPILEKLALVTFKSKQMPGDWLLLKPLNKDR